MALHLSKVAFGCTDVAVLAERHTARATGGESWIETRYRPTRADALVGGSLYWIIRHQLVARSPILGFDAVDGRCRIRIDARLVAVRPQGRRAHQGWRYLTAADAPRDLIEGEIGGEMLPARLAGELAALMLI